MATDAPAATTTSAAPAMPTPTPGAPLTTSDYDYLFKILLVGDSGVGKSSILLRFTDDRFEEDQACTIGVDFKTKIIASNGKRINLTIWDTAGQEKFRALTSSYYRGTHGIILVYDVTSRESYDHITMWLNEVDLYATSSEVVKLLVGNKMDKDASRQVSREEGMELARSKGMLFIESSAKTKFGIQKTFEELVQKILENPSIINSQTRRKAALDPTANLSQNQQPQDPGCYC